MASSEFVPLDPETLRNPSCFTISQRGMYKCKLCPEVTVWMELSRALNHEDTRRHVLRVREQDCPYDPSSDPIGTHACLSGESDDERRSSPLPPSSPVPSIHSDTGGSRITPSFAIHGPALNSDPPDAIYDDWAGNLAAEKPELIHDSHPQNTASGPSNDSLWAGYESDSGDDLTGIIEESHGQSEPDDTGDSDGEEMGHDWTNGFDFNEDVGIEMPDHDAWWPWRSKQHCILSVLGAFPRAAFSDSETQIASWCATKLGAGIMPSIPVLKRARNAIVKLAGSQPRLWKSIAGNFYAKTDLKTILMHEISNPRVRPHLSFYPEDAGCHLSEARHGERWLSEVDAQFAAVMARASDKQDYFVDEPALANIDHSGTPAPLLPVRFFYRNNEMWVMAHRLSVSEAGDGFVIEATQLSDLVELPLEALFMSYPRFAREYGRYSLPSPENVIGVRKNTDRAPTSIVLLHHTLPSIWRVKAAGRRVHSLPLWFYCDDTSGNSSKKWNKHNSFLFVLAGLPREQVHLAYNIHFISTSNLTPPLEMAEGLVHDLKCLQQDGLVAWDCELREEVVFIPWGLGWLGDNPMQSELCSHIGLQGKYFCRVCKVCGKDVNRVATSDGEKLRLKEFLTISDLRTRELSLLALREQWEHVVAGAPSRVDTAATNSGIKDKHFMTFVQIIADAISNLKSMNREQGKPLLDGLAETIQLTLEGQEFPSLVNPILFMKELDPHADTPVEILHVVLLGFVKYFWRDAVSRQGSEGRRILKARLSSLPVNDLNLSPIDGHTLVQYAKSLTGRDFRVIVQVAPAVLYDLIPPQAYEAWLALCRLCPLIFQPEINDRDSYLDALTKGIDDFLLATVLWNPQWFNKPKFHVLLHLARHIQRFGPAILFATEGFESYNFIIRLRSILSNRHAPSVDIANAMSFMHAVRHLVSGGYIAIGKSTVHYRQAGVEVQALLKDTIFVKFMGMTQILESPHSSTKITTAKGEFFCELEHVIQESNVCAALLSHVHNVPNPKSVLIRQCTSLTLSNGDKTTPDGFVLVSQVSRPQTVLARVKSIIQCDTGLMGIVAVEWSVGGHDNVYHMPVITAIPGGRVFFIPVKNILCSVHTFHNCHIYRCKISQTRVIRQERQESGRMGDEICHSHGADDRLINLAQLRSASLLQRFRWPERFPGKTRDEVLNSLSLQRENENPDTDRPPEAHAPKGRYPRKRKRAMEPTTERQIQSDQRGVQEGHIIGTLRPAAWS